MKKMLERIQNTLKDLLKGYREVVESGAIVKTKVEYLEKDIDEQSNTTKDVFQRILLRLDRNQELIYELRRELDNLKRDIQEYEASTPQGELLTLDQLAQQVKLLISADQEE